MIAMYGKPFLTSAKDGFLLVVSNPVRASVLGFVNSFLIFISKLSVTSLMGVGAFYLFTNQLETVAYFDDLNHYWIPVGVSF